jgi:hypothetical protein
MSEKRGQTETLRYDFNTVIESQVQLQNGKWYRVTCREFISFNGPRRFVRYSKGEPSYEEYNAPLYYWNTNIRCKKPKEFGTQYIHTMKREVQLRPHERHYLDKK